MEQETKLPDDFPNRVPPIQSPKPRQILDKDGSLSFNSRSFNSPNYKEGKAGWRLKSNGDAEFQDTILGSLRFSRFTIQTSFESIDGWNKSGGTGFFNYLGYIEGDTSTVLNNTQNIFVPTDDLYNVAPSSAKNPLFEIVAATGGTGTKDARIGIGQLSSDNGVGFKLTKTQVSILWFTNSNVETTALISGINPQAIHTYRARVNYGNTIQWYIDGTLVYSLPWPSSAPAVGTSQILTFYVKNTESGKVASVAGYSALYQQDF